MSRRICVDLHDALIRLRPAWAAETLKVVMTGSAEDGPAWQPHIRSKDARRKLANRFKDPRDPFRIVIVRDMWLPSFDAPCLHTMYTDKPMQGEPHGDLRPRQSPGQVVPRRFARSRGDHENAAFLNDPRRILAPDRIDDERLMR